MHHLANRLLQTCLLALSLISPTWASGIVSGLVVSVSAGDVLELVDAHGGAHRLRLAFIDSPELGHPFGVEARSALSAMVLGRQVTAQLHEKSAEGLTLAEVVEPNGHLVNLELVKRGLAWYDYFAAHLEPERDTYQAAVATAQRARQGVWAPDRIEVPQDFRVGADQALRWWLYAVAALSSILLLGWVYFFHEKRLLAWIERQDQLLRPSTEANRLAHPQSEAAERDRI